MELILELKEEFSLVALILGVFYTVVKGIFIIKIKQLWGHLKRRKVVYGVFIGSVGTLFFLYSFFTVKTQVDIMQSKFDKYENLKEVVNNGSVVMDFLSFSQLLEEDSRRDFATLHDQNTKVVFLNRHKWKETHLTNIYGTISVDRKENQVKFVYKAIHGKNKNSNLSLSTNDYNNDNPSLFSQPLILKGKDKEAFLSGTVDKCVERGLKKDLKKMKKDFDNNIYKYNVCDFRASFFFTTGRWKNSNGEYHKQKTFNEINYIYYMLVPIASEGKSSLYLYYGFNSGNEYFLDQPVLGYLNTFLKKVNVYKEKVKGYENNNKAI